MAISITAVCMYSQYEHMDGWIKNMILTLLQQIDKTVSNFNILNVELEIQ